MNKNLMIIVGFIIILLVGAGGFMMLSKSKNSNPKTSVESAKQDKNAFTSIQDAIAHSMTISCDYSTPEGTTVKAYIKGGKVRANIVGKTADVSSDAIIMDKKVYVWNSKSAYVMTMPDLSATVAPGEDKMDKGSSTVENLEQYKQYCKPGVVDNSLFVLPTGVKFQDMDAMMMAPSGAKAMPSGMVMPSGMSKEQVQEMMKQYSNPQH